MALGDTCMPDIVEIIGYAILEAERRQKQLAFALK